MKKIKWIEGDRIQIDPPKRTKKITGTRFATILGLNPWSTPFEMWCAITKTYEEPFEDNKYTTAGKTIEPKQADYIKRFYGMNLISPTDKYGADYFPKTWGDFFPESPHLGGMWDYLKKDEDGKIEAVLEMKTTKRIEDWLQDIPEDYALQAALYAYLLGVDNVMMVASFLQTNDYNSPKNYKPDASNTIVEEFKLSQRYPNFKDKIEFVENWWKEHVETGISPIFDEKKDANILKALRTKTIDVVNQDIHSMMLEAEALKTEIDAIEWSIKEKVERFSALNKAIKEYLINQLGESDKKIEMKGSNYQFSVSKSQPKAKISYNEEAMKADGINDKYTNLEPTKAIYRLNISSINK